MDRRSFLRRAAIASSGIVAADQLELLDRLGWVRRWFTSVALVPPSRDSVSDAHVRMLLDRWYVEVTEYVKGLPPAPSPLVWSTGGSSTGRAPDCGSGDRGPTPRHLIAEEEWIRKNVPPHLVRGVDWGITRTTYPQWDDSDAPRLNLPPAQSRLIIDRTRLDG
jgi:hypothetical protein